MFVNVCTNEPACSRAILRAVALTKLEDVDESESSQIVKQVSIDNCNIGSCRCVFMYVGLLNTHTPPPFSATDQDPLIQTRLTRRTLAAITNWTRSQVSVKIR